jgi:hypothetical protein
MKYAGGSCPSPVGRLSKAGAAGMKSGLCRAAAAVAVMGCVGTSAAFADTNVLPAPSFGILFPEASTGTSVPTPLPLGADAENLALLDPGAVSGALSAQGTGEPFPSVAMSVQFSSAANCFCGVEFQATSALGYYVEFTGPTADVSVDVSGFYKLTANGPTDSEVWLTVNPTPINAVAAQFIVLDQDTAGTTISPFSTVLSLPTGTPIAVGWWRRQSSPNFRAPCQPAPISIPTSLSTRATPTPAHIRS